MEKKLQKITIFITDMERYSLNLALTSRVSQLEKYAILFDRPEDAKLRQMFLDEIASICSFRDRNSDFH